MAQQIACHLLKHGNQPLVESVLVGKQFIEKSLSYFSDIRFNQPSGGTQFLIEFPVDDVEAFADYMMVEYGLVLATSNNYVGVEGSFVRIPMGYPAETLKRALVLLRKGLKGYPFHNEKYSI
ncbi:MAG: hypothetical protein AB1297_00755 [bacterium]